MLNCFVLWFFVCCLAGCSSTFQPESYRPKTWSQLSKWTCSSGPKPIAYPAEVKALDGQLLELRGYMVPLEVEGETILSFVLVRDQMMCCFGKMPSLNEWVFVKMSRGSSLEEMTDKPIVVSGRFHASEQREDGVIVSIYQMEADRVKVLQGTPKGWKAN